MEYFKRGATGPYMDVEKLFPAIVQGNGLHCGKNGYTSSMD